MHRRREPGHRQQNPIELTPVSSPIGSSVGSSVGSPVLELVEWYG